MITAAGGQELGIMAVLWCGVDGIAVGEYPSGRSEYHKCIHNVKYHHQGHHQPLHELSHCIGQLRLRKLVMAGLHTFPM